MRFNRPSFPTTHFSNEIWVKCPDCNGLGLIVAELSKYNVPSIREYKASFECKHCGLCKKSKADWYGYWQAVIRQACGFCGSKITYSSEPTKERYETLAVNCDTCQRTSDYKLKWHRYKVDKPTDPFFGLDLWLQKSIKSKVLWLYNLDHLNYLREYVSATLRESQDRHKYSMITNLPQWIKSAKNRDIIVNKLEVLKVDFEKEMKNSVSR